MSLAVCFLNLAAYAQSGKPGTWGVVNVVYKPFKHLAFFTDAQLRAQTIANNFYYAENNLGIIYSVPQKISVIAAAGRHLIFNYPGNFKNLQAKEFRLWEQVTFTTNFNPLRIDHRFRIEQRWINSNYSNRLRYRLNPVMPINKKKLAAQVVYAFASAEIFLADKSPHFTQSQLSAGAGYYFSKVTVMQLNYIRQNSYPLSGGTGKNFLQTTLLFTIDKSAMPHVNRHPSMIN